MFIAAAAAAVSSSQNVTSMNQNLVPLEFRVRLIPVSPVTIDLYANASIDSVI